MKLMLLRDEWSMLENEANVYRTLAGPGIPQVYWSGHQDDYYVLVHEILGPSLDDLFYYCEQKFSLKTLLLIADQAIRRIQHIHSKGYLHLDIKPDNFLMGLGRQGNLIYSIDFGLAQEFSGDSWGLGGGGRTLRYASLNTHYGRRECLSTSTIRLHALTVIFQNSPGVMTWSHWDTSSCISPRVHFRGRVSTRRKRKS